MKHRSRTQGFTLIELLVVIAIIAILAAILFPVFAQAREQARKTSCLSNVKQIGLGIAMYVQDYDETFPFAWGWDPNRSTQMEWYTVVMPYIRNGENMMPTARGTLAGKSGIFHCPSDADQGVSYALNSFISGAGADLWGPVADAPETLAGIDRPADCVALGESIHAYKGGIAWDTPTDYVRWIEIRDTAGVPNVTGKNSPAIAAWYQDYLKNKDFTAFRGDMDTQGDLPGACPEGPWMCKYPAFRHQRIGFRTGNANFAFSDGHAKNFRYGALRIVNFLTVVSPENEIYNN